MVVVDLPRNFVLDTRDLIFSGCLAEYALMCIFSGRASLDFSQA